VLHHAFAPWQLREPAFLHRFLGADLVAHHPDHLRAGADPAQAGVLDHLRELGIFAEEAVPGVDGVGPAHLRRGEDGGNVEITLFGRRRTDAERLVRESDVQRVRIRGGLHGDGLPSVLALGAGAAGGCGLAACTCSGAVIGAAIGTASTAVVGGGWPRRRSSVSCPETQIKRLTSVPCSAARIAFSLSTSTRALSNQPTRVRYSPVRVSIFKMSPSLMKSGTCSV